MQNSYDVVVVGGGPAGLAAAVALARARRSVLVVDAGEPRNAPAGHIHNLLGREGTPPAELLAAGRAEVEGYGGELARGRVTSVTRDGTGFVVHLDGGTRAQARRILLATGLVDVLPDVPGLRERWGRDVLHCPYCHGWEVREQRIGVLATGPAAVHHALLWRQWTDRVVLFTNGTFTPDDDATARFRARGILVVPEQVVEVLVVDDALTGVRLASGDDVPLGALVAGGRMDARADLAATLGLQVEDVEMAGQVIGSRIAADPRGATGVPGVFVAGNVTDVSAQVGSSASGGTFAAAMVNMDLVEEETRAAVDGYADRTAEFFAQPAWEERYRANAHIWSGNPNWALVEVASDLAPGRALDVGCGEGADAVWLARRGWTVTGADISTLALERAAEHAKDAGVDVTWLHADLREDPPACSSYDLVSAQYMHLPPDQRQALYAALAAAVAPGGVLLVAAHHPRDLRDGLGHQHMAEMRFTAEEVAADLEASEPGRWEVLRAETVARTRTVPSGTMHHNDALLVARRRP